MMSDSDINKRVAIVTGGSKGIGRSVAVHLAKAGFKVCISSRHKNLLKEAEASLKEIHSDVTMFQCDITKIEQFKNLVSHTEATLGPVDVLVNNAGVAHCTLISNFMVENWHEMIDINCKGLVNGVAAALPGMLERKKGHIVNMSSLFGHRPHPYFAVLSATKCFVGGFTLSLRKEVASTGIRVTSIQPGAVNTTLLAKNQDHEGLKRFASQFDCPPIESDDVAKAVVFAVTQTGHVAVNELALNHFESSV